MAVTINGTTGVAGVDGSAGTPSYQGSDANSGVWFPAADVVAISTNGTEAMRVDPSQNVGIGTTNPTARFEVNVSTTAARFVGNDGNNYIQVSDNNGTNFASFGSISGGNAYMYAGISNYAAFYTGGFTERMRLTATGNLVIGGTTVSSPAGYQPLIGVEGAYPALTLNSPSQTRKYSIGIDSTAKLVFSDETAGQGRMAISSTGAVYLNGLTGGNTNAGSFGANGIQTRSGFTGSFSGNTFNIDWTGTPQLWVDTTNIGTFSFTSDYRVKKNVQTQTAPGIDRIMQLRPVTYELADYGDLFKADGVVREGFIAHEIQEIIPSGAEGQKDEEDRIQNLRVDAILSVAVKAIQELSAKMDAMQAEIDALKWGA